ncbi:MAG: VCBS repeat-containing protein [Paracoccaceae bacterium]
MRALAAAALLCAVAAAALADPVIRTARFDSPVARYGHDILGQTPEWGALRLGLADCADCPVTSERLLRLPRTAIFEDLAPRLADLDGDGAPEVVVVETRLDAGARLAVFSADGLLAATPYIGRKHRWLAPAAIADLDGDGAVEIAYVDRPHLARVLRIWRYRAGALQPVTEVAGLTNHRIGDAFISGGLRACPGQRPEVVLTDPDWSRILAVTLDAAGKAHVRDRGRLGSARDFGTAMGCNQANRPSPW